MSEEQWNAIYGVIYIAQNLDKDYKELVDILRSNLGCRYDSNVVKDLIPKDISSALRSCDPNAAIGIVDKVCTSEYDKDECIEEFFETADEDSAGIYSFLRGIMQEDGYTKEYFDSVNRFNRRRR